MATTGSLDDFRYPISEEAAYRARVHVGVTIPLLALCLMPFCARLYVRTRPVWRLAWDDFFIVLGLVRLSDSPGLWLPAPEPCQTQGVSSNSLE
jgi:hypothetical protein